jgi:hypothetical protein
VQTAATNVVDINNFADIYQIGPNAPTTRYDSTAIQPGDLWFDTLAQVIKAWDGDVWGAITPNQSDLNDIAVVANDLSTESDLGSIADPLLAGQSGGALETCGNSISAIQTVATNIADVNVIVDNIADINTVENSIISVNTVAGVSANVTTVAGSINSVNTVSGAISNVNAVGGSIANVNYVGGSIADVNRYAAEYTISASQPTSPTMGRLWFDTVNSVLKYFNGSIFSSIAAGISQIQSDTSPTLGGHLNANSKNINNVSTIDGADLTIDFGTI